jgi:hypothetical protein
MDPNKIKEGFEQELQQIEELELKTAPCAGDDSVLPIPFSFGGHH